MSVISFLRDLTGLFNYSTDQNPTTQQDYQAAVQNWVTTETSLVDAVLWQPSTEYSVGDMVKTPSLGSKYYLVCDTAGTSGSTEADFTNVGTGDTVTDGSVEWTVAENLTTATVGTVVSYVSSSSVSVPQGTATSLGSISLSAGTWVVTGHATYASTVANSRVSIGINTSVAFAFANDGTTTIIHPYDSGQQTSLQTTMILTLASTTTVYLVGYVAAGDNSTSSTGVCINAVRIK